jgi:transposase InsO family protein
VTTGRRSKYSLDDVDRLVRETGAKVEVARGSAVIGQFGAERITIRPHCPWQNGKVERFNRTLQTEWTYRQVFTTNDTRTQALQPWLEYYNHQRRHHALGGQPPITRLTPTS